MILLTLDPLRPPDRLARTWPLSHLLSSLTNAPLPTG
jgi:hypothetical protein